DGVAGAPWQDQAAPAAALATRRFDRALDASWRRTSYSGITADTHNSGDPRVGSETEQAVVSDEGPVGLPAANESPHGAPGDEEALRAVPLLLASMPGGVDVGTFVHAVLEVTDFATPDLGSELAAKVAKEQARQNIELGDLDAVVAGLRAAIETPLGPSVGDVRLRDIGASDRLNELWFELPLVGGDAPRADLSVAAIGALLRRHLPSDDVFAGYADRLDDPALRNDLRGYLAGSLDLVIRVPGDDGAPRFAVVDHKTNWLGIDGEELTAWHYRPTALAAEMERAHYPLQALLYSAALHRYLRWRLPHYDPARHLGGAVYLFLRGMVGSGAPRVGGQPCGVLTWNPPAALIVALSDLLDRGIAAA
nr:exodeoxyribonuclease V [Actinomycetota bacterium]